MSPPLIPPLEKRKRGRPRKTPTPIPPIAKRPRGRPRKIRVAIDSEPEDPTDWIAPLTPEEAGDPPPRSVPAKVRKFFNTVFLADRIDRLDQRIRRIEATGGATNEDMLGAYDKLTNWCEALEHRIDSFEESTARTLDSINEQIRALSEGLATALEPDTSSPDLREIWGAVLTIRALLTSLSEEQKTLFEAQRKSEDQLNWALSQLGGSVTE